MSEHSRKVLEQKKKMQKKYLKMEKALKEIIKGGECNYCREVASDALKKEVEDGE